MGQRRTVLLQYGWRDGRFGNSLFPAGIARVGSNGGVRFGGTGLELGVTNAALPSSGAFSHTSQALLPFWDDLSTVGGTVGEIYWQETQGHLIVQWQNAGFFNTPGETATFQIQVPANGGNVKAQFLYQDIQGVRADGGGSATIGYQAGNGPVDVAHWSFNTPASVANGTVLSLVPIAPMTIGTNYCAANPNSTGVAATISGTGSTSVALNNVTLSCENLPSNSFGFFLTSSTQGFIANPGGSQGNLCLSGAIGRFVGPGQILNSGAAGSFSLPINWNSLPQPTGPVAVMSGETWNFQCWYRDAPPGGAAVSNFTMGLVIALDASLIPPLVPIPAGTFWMGSDAPNGPPYGGPIGPVHEVTISYAFWMGQFEVTQEEYWWVMGTTPSFHFGNGRPVEQVSWYNARAYCSALTAQNASNLPAGFEYRLPTEAEWEYACRAATTTESHYGDELFCNQAHLSSSLHSNSSCCVGGTAIVGNYTPNAFGLHDMHGNVREWCLDSFATYSAGAVTDPFVTGGNSPVMRGGTWAPSSDQCRSAHRFGFVPGYRDKTLGFRIVLAPILVP